MALLAQGQLRLPETLPEAVFFVVVHNDSAPHPHGVKMLQAILQRWQTLSASIKEKFIPCIDAAICSSFQEVLEHLSLLPTNTEIVLISDDTNNSVICSTGKALTAHEALPSYLVWDVRVCSRTEAHRRIGWCAGYVLCIYGKRERQNPPQGKPTDPGPRQKTSHEQKKLSRRSNRPLSMYFSC